MDPSTDPISTIAAEAAAASPDVDDRSVVADLEAADSVVDAFLRIRDWHRGHLAAPASSLPADVDRILAAILALREGAGLVRQRELEEALFDLAAFIDDADAALIRDTVTPPKWRRDDPGPYHGAVKRLQAQRQRLMRAWHDGRSAYDLWAFGTPVPIGQARRELDAYRNVGYTEGTGLLGAVILIGMTLLAAVLGKAWYLVLAVGMVVGLLSAWVSADLATRIERAWRQRDPTDAAEERRARMHGRVAVYGSLVAPPVIIVLLFFR